MTTPSHSRVHTTAFYSPWRLVVVLVPVAFPPLLGVAAASVSALSLAVSVCLFRCPPPCSLPLVALSVGRLFSRVRVSTLESPACSAARCRTPCHRHPDTRSRVCFSRSSALVTCTYRRRTARFRWCHSPWLPPQVPAPGTPTSSAVKYSTWSTNSTTSPAMLSKASNNPDDLPIPAASGFFLTRSMSANSLSVFCFIARPPVLALDVPALTLRLVALNLRPTAPIPVCLPDEIARRRFLRCRCCFLRCFLRRHFFVTPYSY